MVLGGFRLFHVLVTTAGNGKNDDLFFEGNKTVFRFSDYTLVGIIRCFSVQIIKSCSNS